MAEHGNPTDSGGSTDQIGLQELVGDANNVVRAFVLLLETIGGSIEFPFEKLGDPSELTNRTIYVEYDEIGRMIRYTVKHHEEITGELVAPENRDSE